MLGFSKEECRLVWFGCVYAMSNPSNRCMRLLLSPSLDKYIQANDWRVRCVLLWHSHHVLAVLFYNWRGDQGKALLLQGKPGKANQKHQHRADLPQQPRCSLVVLQARSYHIHYVFATKKPSQNQNKALCHWRQSPAWLYMWWEIYITLSGTRIGLTPDVRDLV